MEQNGSSYIPTLDGWRAIALMLVLFDHGLLVTFRPYGWARAGAHGVDIFFVLSGYLISGKLLEDGSLPKFYIRRAFRILPVLFSYLAVVCILGFGLRKIPLLRSEVALSLFFVRNYVFYSQLASTGVTWFTAHLWSLSIEEQFYLIWPLVMLKVVKGAPRHRLVMALSWFGFWAALFVSVHEGRILRFYEGITIGCLLRLAFHDPQVSTRIRRMFSGRSTLVVGAVFAYFAIFYYRTSFFDPLVCGLGLCATLVEPGAWAGRTLEFSALRWIGRLSYSLYIWQQLFLGFGVAFRPFGFFSRFPVNLASVMALSCLSYYLMERPLMRLGHLLSNSATRKTNIAQIGQPA